MSIAPFRIGVFTSNSSMIEHIKRHVTYDDEVDIVIATQGLEDAIPVAKTMERDGVEIILGRRGTAHILRESLQIPVLAFPQSDMNLILRLKEASMLGKKIVFPIFRSKLDHLDSLCELLNINAMQKIYTGLESLEEVIAHSQKQGFEVVVGGPHSVEIAKAHGLKTAEIQSSPETIVSTIEDAKSVVHSQRLEHEKYLEYKTILNSTMEGIISVDRGGEISMINAAALDLLEVSESDALGIKISRIINSPQLLRAMNEKRKIKDNIEEIGGKHLVFSHTPVLIGSAVVGGVSTFTDTSNLIKTESKVRKKLSKGFTANYGIDDLIHCSKEMREVINRVRLVARADSAILINGETGTGKEIVAHSIHALSKRNRQPFVSINCAAIPEHLLESELFGYDEGAFTGSRKGGKPGLFELAHNGSIFLDEISAAADTVQTRLLRVLQEREVMRIGSDQVIPIDVRVIAAANKDMASATLNGSFREDLYFRISALSIKLPPLRERSMDIPLLLKHFMQDAEAKYKLSPLTIPGSYLNLLINHPWPGNIRQLKNFSERLVLLSDARFNPALFDELFEELEEYYQKSRPVIRLGNIEAGTADDFKEKIINQRNRTETDIIMAALEESRYNRNETAKILGISRGTLWRKMKNLGLLEKENSQD